MATLNLTPKIFIIIIITVLFSSLSIPTIQSEQFSRKLSKKALGIKKEKLSHLHFYFHDTHSGKNPSAIKVVNSPSNSTQTDFGSVYIIDNPLTVGPNLSSKLIGQAQGMYASACTGFNDFGFLMVLNYYFVEGKYNGSTISIMGRNPVLSPVREMPVIGGSGLFRYARGYALAHTHSMDFTTGDAVVEYNVYVYHYGLIIV